MEIGAEATLDGKEPWTAQASLYRQLGCQLKTLWPNGTGHKADNGAEEPIGTTPEPESSPTPSQPPGHYCQEHQTPFKRYSRGENAWYSHKTADGKWCKEK